MSKIGDLRAGLKTNLDGIPGFNVSRYALSNPVPPVIHLWPTSITYHRAMQMGLQEVIFRVEAVVSFVGTDQGPQALVDKLLDGEGAESVVAAVEAEPTLGGECQNLIVDSMDAYEVAATSDNQARLIAAWSVRVLV